MGMNKTLTNVGLGLAVMLLICLFPMPYGYYNLVRFGAMIVFAIMAYNYFQQNKQAMAVLFAALAILFQPLFKIALGRLMWNVVDVVVAILLFVLWYVSSKKLN